MKRLVKVVAACCVILPWFFKGAFGDAIFFIAGSGYGVLVATDLFPPRDKLWWWAPVQHLAFLLGCALIALPVVWSINRPFAIVLFSLGAMIISFIGLSARMESIGRSNTAFELCVEFIEKIKARKMR